MISLNITQESLDHDIGVANEYDYSETPGTGSGLDPFGIHEFYIENNPNIPFINKGLDDTGYYNWYQQPNNGLIIRIGTPLIETEVTSKYKAIFTNDEGIAVTNIVDLIVYEEDQLFVYGPRSNPLAQNGNILSAQWREDNVNNGSFYCICCPRCPPNNVKVALPFRGQQGVFHKLETPPWMYTEGNLFNNGGVAGDPHFEGFDDLFDFHGKAGKFYQLYKSKSLLINCRMNVAYHCQDNGTFMESLYVRSYQNGKEFEVIFAICGTSDTSHAFIPLKDLDKHITMHPSMNEFSKEIKNNNWKNDFGSLVKTDVGDIYLIQSTYLCQPHVNLKFSPNCWEKEATGIIGQTQNRKIRLPNDSFEIPNLNSDNVIFC